MSVPNKSETTALDDALNAEPNYHSNTFIRGGGGLPRVTILTADFEAVEPDTQTVPSRNCFVNEILHFEECCRQGKEPISSGRDNIETIKMIMGIYESSRTGRAVDLDSL